MYIVDTMLVSYIFRGDPLALPYRPELESDQPLYLSAQTIGELYFGAEYKGWGKPKQQKIDSLVSEYVVLPIDHETAMHYAAVRAVSKKAGRFLTSQDAWIVATAKQYGLTLISNDLDVTIGECIGIRVICRA
jgi:tRNA(fMet)-specific endonuclease VapC